MTLSATPEARRRAGARWKALRERLQSVSPQALARGLIATAVVGLAAWLAVGTWPTLLPFAAGAILAYAVLPIANRLDRFMPRFLAAILAELVAVGILVAVLVLVVPPLLNGLLKVALVLPTGEQVQAWLHDLEAQLGQLPDPLGGILLAVATEASANLQQALNGLVEGAGAFVTSQVLGILGTASFLLGLLVIPVWVLTIVADERSIKRRGATLLAPAIRGDAYALFRIVDRALGTFLRVRVLLAIVTALLIWVGLMLATELGLGPFPFAVTAAVLLGALQLMRMGGWRRIRGSEIASRAVVSLGGSDLLEGLLVAREAADVPPPKPARG
jgi:predicted PurR-regulated permease PerM